MMRTTLSAFVLTMLLVVSASPVAAITYGEPTGSGMYQNVGSIVIEIEGEYYQVCTGTLIKSGVMLTAAHCLVGLPDGDLYVTFSHQLGPSADLIGVTNTTHHPRFGKSTANLYDLGLLWFAPNGIDPAPIAPLGYLAELGRRERRDATYTAVGYGTVRESRKTGWQGILDNTERRYVDQSFLSLQKAWLTLSMNEATGDGGTCYGDSGGPHFHDGFIVSLTVTGDAVCKATDKTYRLDCQWVYDFLDGEGVLPS